MKRCHSCATDLPVSEFWKCATRSDGLQTQCKGCKRSANAKWKAENVEKTRVYVNACAAKNRTARRASAKKRYDGDIEAHRARARESAKRRHVEIAAYVRERRAAAPAVRLRGRISNQLRYCLSTGKGGRASAELLGYSMAELRAHLERQFLKGMNWENMGEWHIDHITPPASFTITGADDPELRRAWSLPNLRPLWATDNMSKGAKLETLL